MRYFIFVIFLAGFLIFGCFNFAQAANPLYCVNINTAPKEELEKIKHIGEARAEQIINLRGEELFSSVDDLDRVVGIGPSRLADIKEQGLACVEDEASVDNDYLTGQVEPDEPAVEVKLQQTYPSGIVINEILPSPTGPDAEEEWIEIFNQNNFVINISGWEIADNEGKAQTYTFPEGTTVDPQGFLVLSCPTTKITLNNDGDGLKLIQPNGNIIDMATYEKAPKGESFNRVDTGWTWSANLTPGSENIVPTPAPSEESPEAKKQLAAVGPQIPKSSRSLYVFLTALGLAIFSGVIILMLKNKIKKGIIKKYERT